MPFESHRLPDSSYGRVLYDPVSVEEVYPTGLGPPLDARSHTAKLGIRLKSVHMVMSSQHFRQPTAHLRPAIVPYFENIVVPLKSKHENLGPSYSYKDGKLSSQGGMRPSTQPTLPYVSDTRVTSCQQVLPYYAVNIPTSSSWERRQNVSNTVWTFTNQPSRLENEMAALEKCRSLKRTSEILPHRVDKSYYMTGASKKIHHRYEINEEELRSMKQMTQPFTHSRAPTPTGRRIFGIRRSQSAQPRPMSTKPQSLYQCKSEVLTESDSIKSSEIAQQTHQAWSENFVESNEDGEVKGDSRTHDDRDHGMDLSSENMGNMTKSVDENEMSAVSENIQPENIQSENIQSENIQSENIQSENIQSKNIQSEKANIPNLNENIPENAFNKTDVRSEKRKNDSNDECDSEQVFNDSDSLPNINISDKTDNSAEKEQSLEDLDSQAISESLVVNGQNHHPGIVENKNRTSGKYTKTLDDQIDKNSSASVMNNSDLENSNIIKSRVSSNITNPLAVTSSKRVQFEDNDQSQKTSDLSLTTKSLVTDIPPAEESPHAGRLSTDKEEVPVPIFTMTSDGVKTKREDVLELDFSPADDTVDDSDGDDDSSEESDDDDDLDGLTQAQWEGKLLQGLSGSYLKSDSKLSHLRANTGHLNAQPKDNHSWVLDDVYSFVSSEQKIVFQKAFASLDSNNNGVVSRDELQSQMFQNSTQRDLDLFVKVFDVNKDDTVDETEFVTVAALNDKLCGNVTNDNAGPLKLDLPKLAYHITAFKEMFDLLDSDGDRSLSVEELMLMMTVGISEKIGTDKHLLDLILQTVDSDHSGRIEFVEFLSFIPFFLGIYSHLLKKPALIEDIERARHAIRKALQPTRKRYKKHFREKTKDIWDD